MAVVMLVLVLVYASVSDCLTHRIPNWLCVLALFVGIGLQMGSVESPGAMAMMASVVVPFLIFIPFYIGGGMAAGDVKLMASCGALLGWPIALLGAGYALVAGTLMGVCFYVYRGGWQSFASRYGTALKMMYMTGNAFMTPAEQSSVARSRFPYALAIAVGCLASVVLPVG